jgi:hypothetical protein
VKKIERKIGKYRKEDVGIQKGRCRNTKRKMKEYRKEDEILQKGR